MATPNDQPWIALLAERLQMRCFASSPTCPAANVLAVTRLYLAELTGHPPVRIPVECTTALLDELIRYEILTLVGGQSALSDAGAMCIDAFRETLIFEREKLRALGAEQLRERAFPPEQGAAPGDATCTVNIGLLQNSREATGWLLGAIVREVTPVHGTYMLPDLRAAVVAALPNLFAVSQPMTNADADAAIAILIERNYLVLHPHNRYGITRQGSDLAEQFSRGSFRPMEDEDDSAPAAPPKPKKVQLSIRRAVVAELQNGQLGEQLFTHVINATSPNFERNYDISDLRTTIRAVGPPLLLVEATTVIVGEILRFFERRAWMKAILVRDRVESYRLTVVGMLIVGREEKTGT